MTDYPDEWLDAACEAIADDTADRDDFEGIARTVLDAVVPLIQAAERDRLVWMATDRIQNPDRYEGGEVDAALHGGKPEKNPQRWGTVPLYAIPAHREGDGR